MVCIIMKKLTIKAENDLIDGYEDLESLKANPMAWNSVSTIKAGNKWFASYDMLKCDATVVIGTGLTEQEAIDNLPARELL